MITNAWGKNTLVWVRQTQIIYHSPASHASKGANKIALLDWGRALLLRQETFLQEVTLSLLDLQGAAARTAGPVPKAVTQLNEGQHLH